MTQCIEGKIHPVRPRHHAALNPANEARNTNSAPRLSLGPSTSRPPRRIKRRYGEPTLMSLRSVLQQPGNTQPSITITSTLNASFVWVREGLYLNERIGVLQVPAGGGVSGLVIGDYHLILGHAELVGLQPSRGRLSYRTRVT